MQKIGLSIDDVFLDLKQDLIPVSFAVNNFGEINSGTGDYSTDFKVDGTWNNVKALKYSEDINLNTREQFKQQNAVLYVGSLEVYGFVQIVNFDRRRNEFTLAFYSGNAEWFSLAKNISIKDLDFSQFDHRYTPAEIVANANNAEGFCYPIVDYGYNTDNPYNTIEVTQIFPATYVSEIMKAGFRAIGYKAKYATLLTDQRFTRAILPYSSKDAPSHFQKFRDKLYSAGTLSEIGIFINSPQTFDADITPTTTSENLPPLATSYIANESGVVTVDVDFALIATGAVSRLDVLVDTVIVSTVATDIEKTGSLQVEVELEVGQVVSFLFTITPFPDFGSGSMNATVRFTFGSKIKEGSKIQLGAFLPNITFADFMTLLTKQFNLLFQAKMIDQTITVFKFRDVIDNISEAKDWSNKIDWNGKAMQDYQRITDPLAKNNKFTYAEAKDDILLDKFGEDIGSVYGSGLKVLNNAFLQNEVDYVSITFAPTINSFGWGGAIYAPFIPVVSFENEKIKANDPKFRVLLVNVNTPVSEFSDYEEINIVGLNATETLTTASFAWFWKQKRNNNIDNIKTSLAFDTPSLATNTDRGLLIDYYENFENLFTFPVLIELDGYLSSVDINALDFSKPIYIQRPYNAYFFLNRVIEFIGQDYTVGVELLKIS